MDDKRRCTAKSTRSGKRCKKAAIVGGTVCATHGGAASHVRRAADERAARQDAEQKAQRMVALTGVDQDPIEHLLESLHRAASLVEVWGAMVADIDEKAEEESKGENGFLRGQLGYEAVESDKGFTDTVVTPRDRMMAVNSKGDSMVHPYVTEYQAALDRRAKFAKLCIDAGVETRQVELYEQQVELAHGAFEAGLAALDLTDEQKQEARRAYADRLRTP